MGFQIPEKFPLLNYRGFIVAAGLSGFIYTRNQVVSNRARIMKSKQRIQEARRQDGEAQYKPKPT